MTDDGYNSMQTSPRDDMIIPSSLFAEQCAELIKRCEEHEKDCEDFNKSVEQDKNKSDEVEKLLAAYNKLSKISQLITEIEALENEL